MRDATGRLLGKPKRAKFVTPPWAKGFTKPPRGTRVFKCDVSDGFVDLSEFVEVDHDPITLQALAKLREADRWRPLVWG